MAPLLHPTFYQTILFCLYIRDQWGVGTCYLAPPTDRLRIGSGTSFARHATCAVFSSAWGEKFHHIRKRDFFPLCLPSCSLFRFFLKFVPYLEGSIQWRRGWFTATIERLLICVARKSRINIFFLPGPLLYCEYIWPSRDCFVFSFFESYDVKNVQQVSQHCHLVPINKYLIFLLFSPHVSSSQPKYASMNIKT